MSASSFLAPMTLGKTKLCGGCGSRFASRTQLREGAEMLAHTVKIDLSVPSPGGLVPDDAAYAASIVRLPLSVAAVFGVSDLSEIAPTIVVSNAVDVIDLIIWPFTRLDKPNYSMSKISPSINLTPKIPFIVARNKRRLTSVFRVPSSTDAIRWEEFQRALKPEKKAGFSAVTQHGPDLVSTDVGFER